MFELSLVSKNPKTQNDFPFPQTLLKSIINERRTKRTEGHQRGLRTFRPFTTAVRRCWGEKGRSAAGREKSIVNYEKGERERGQ